MFVFVLLSTKPDLSEKQFHSCNYDWDVDIDAIY